MCGTHICFGVYTWNYTFGIHYLLFLVVIVPNERVGYMLCIVSSFRDWPSMLLFMAYDTERDYCILLSFLYNMVVHWGPLLLVC